MPYLCECVSCDWMRKSNDLEEEKYPNCGNPDSMCVIEKVEVRCIKPSATIAAKERTTSR